ncbi:MAG: dehydrogenase, partial [Verrucomicrobiales bacterium]|nr:dehydrogenase [Verrucomicrobiales bacterium]
QHDHGIHAMHFGADGRLYFNFGNAGKRLCDPEGNLITDINGVKCSAEGNRPFQEGMVFRCDLDGKNVELLGWNFRNNWEVCVDSFGTMWQSDNDDDGNKGVRINYVMEYGNFGYKDEITGAGWRDPRPGMSAEIPLRHFHQNDPGVVPNFVQTGAGSPTGICVYEGKLLPMIFQNQVIHCDAGPNVTRAYVRKNDGAGYSAEMVNLLKSETDRWFRPSDVCVAPDGSLFVADWYDPGVGGHGMGDIEKGRIFRVIPKGGDTAYRPPGERPGDGKEPNARTATELYQRYATTPNMAERYHIWNLFADPNHGFQEQTTKRLFELYESGEVDDVAKARLIWFATVMFGDKNPILAKALEDENPDLRITALRAWRQSWEGHREGRQESLHAVLKQMAGDKNPQVRREVALALRFDDSKTADEIWATLAKQYDGDRWYLEALGIGADLCWDDRLAALGDPKPHPDLVWRSRGSKSAERLAEVIIAATGEVDPSLLRGLDFQPAESKAAAFESIFQKAQPEIALAAAGKIGRGQIEKLDGGPERLDELLGPVLGKSEFVILADKLGLRGFENELADFIESNPTSPESVYAARLLLRDQGKLREMLRDSSNPDRVGAIATALGKTNDRNVGRLLGGMLTAKNTPDSLGKTLVNAMATGSNSSRELLKIARDGNLDDSLKTTAALAFARSPDKR